MMIPCGWRNYSKSVWVVALGLVLLGRGITGVAATIVVTNTNDDGAGSLRAALAAATNGDIIDLTGTTGTITLTAGELLVTNDVKIVGPGPDKLVVDGNFPNTTNRVFLIQKDLTNGINVTLSGLTIRNGNASSGAGIMNSRSTLTISNCVISGNQAQSDAGGILSNGTSSTAKLTIINSILSGNLAGYVGGAIYQSGQDGSATLIIIGSTISSNSVGDVGGAGIKNDGSPTGNAMAFITNSTFIGNSTTGRGGAIQNDGFSGNASLVVVNSAFIGNSAGVSDDGGAIYNDGSSHGHAEGTFINTTFSGNSAFRGGAISDDFFGGGSMLLTLISSTFKDNSATIGGGVYNVDRLTIGNTILSAGSSGSNISGAGIIVSQGYNLSSDNGNGGLTNATDQINTNPLLGPLQDNGGPVLTHALLPGSPAIDKGKNLSGATTDARGLPRVFDDPAISNANGGDGTDVGAYESFDLRITAVEKLDGDLRISFTSLPGKNYELQSRSDLNSATWGPLPGNYPGNGAIAHATLTNIFDQPQQFYRIHQLP